MRRRSGFGNTIFLLIVAIVLIAWLTKPNRASFDQFYEQELKSGQPPLIEFNDRFIYTTADISFFTPALIEPGKPLKAVAAKKEEYLGLFGRFWKL